MEWGKENGKGERSSGNGKKVDMVITLHACDTATDYALAKAVEWGSEVILSVPCCQHEVNRQIDCGKLQPILKYGLLKERMSALITDAVRANLLEENGYQVQILEFIDMEHTPKNILIRGVKKKGKEKSSSAGKGDGRFPPYRDNFAEAITVKEIIYEKNDNKMLLSCSSIYYLAVYCQRGSEPGKYGYDDGNGIGHFSDCPYVCRRGGSKQPSWV